MGVVALNDNVLKFECPGCKPKSKEETRSINIDDIVLYSDNRDNVIIKLPRCPECNSVSFLLPDIAKEGTKAHIRRCIVAKLSKANNIDSNYKSYKKEKEEDAAKRIKLAVNKFIESAKKQYVKRDSNLTEEFNGKKKIDIDIRKKEKV